MDIQRCKKRKNKKSELNKISYFFKLEDYSNRVAKLFSSAPFGYKKGDCVAIFMENRPEFVGLWLGLSKLGVISALINTNLKGEPLRHSIASSKALAVIFNSTLEPTIGQIKNDLDKVQLIIDADKHSTIGAVNLNSLLKQTYPDNVDCEYSVASEDTILYIYTSGTTGLPKPAVIKQSRYYGGASTFFRAAGLGANDVVYVTLPIYHGNGTLLGIGSAITVGSTVVLRQKFSASNFWKDCIQYNCTSFIYVGEICRFLVNQAPSAIDRAHKVRKAYGNGLRANVWKEFNQRFGIKCLEFYAASEGNCTMLNLDYKVGSCGFKPLLTRLIKNVYPIFLIKIDEQMNPIRDQEGFCIECEVGEKGLLVGIIGNEPTKAFNGYANNPEASKKKIIENVFKTGQKAFNTGDAMVMDRFGYLYFCDRLGDTYRWRGENVSTVEVENQISRFLNSKEVVVYGVEIPGQEGRAGMVSIADSPNSIDLQGLSKKVKEELPSYARPLFIRFTAELDHTGTFKAKKTKLVEEAYNIKIVKDVIYYFDAKIQIYKPLNKEVYEDILSGRIRL
ncbi:long-chain fatty acid transport 4 [Brachionus plicatilis]|uniref:long-chain-fatty-acid--CoA ligase n=1 Tax=Brachionus plicatilis TaxID=10195 RepID=A0A3M7TBR5_BRAPC|nr:long-chain fatty acid transport 4 [Brachionus plicatilis]